MFIDSSTFPLVFIRTQHNTADGRQPMDFAVFNELLSRERAFVFLSDQEFEDGHQHSQEERKQLTLWMKQNKAAIRTYIKGMIMVESNLAKRLAAQAMAIMFGKFWGYPLVIAESQPEALAIAQSLLVARPDTLAEQVTPAADAATADGG